MEQAKTIPDLVIVKHQDAKHSHPHDQIVYVVHGHLKVTCQEKTFEVRTGDTFVVRGGVEHGASALEGSLVIDVFTPWREDYLA